MFANRQIRLQVEALATLVHAQNDLISVLGTQLDTFRDDARAASQRAKIASAETHLLKALAAALIAEIAAKSDDPYSELSIISKRARYTAKEFSGQDDGSDYIIKESIKMICRHAETYLKRGDPSGKINA